MVIKIFLISENVTFRYTVSKGKSFAIFCSKSSLSSEADLRYVEHLCRKAKIALDNHMQY